MNSFEFLALFSDELGLGLSCVAASCALYALLLRRSVGSPLDPLFLGGVAHAFAAAVVLFLVAVDNIEPYFVASFCLTEVAFWAGFFAFSRPVTLATFPGDTLTGDDVFMRFYACVVVLLFVAVGAFVAKAGVLIVQDVSRLVVAQDLGVLSWLYDGTTMSATVLVLVKRHVLRRRSLTDWAVLAVVLFALVTKGGKSDFVVMCFAVYLVGQAFAVRSLLRTVKVLYILVPALLLLLTAIVLSVWGVEVSPGQALMDRFILFGDVFFQGYDRAAFDSLPDTSWARYFFGSLVDGFVALFGGASRPRVVLGYELSSYYYGAAVEGMGANARHNILGLYLFGFVGALPFSALCGAIVAGLRARPLFGSSTVVAGTVYLIVNIASAYVMIDPALAVGYFIKLGIVLGLAYVGALVLGSERLMGPQGGAEGSSAPARTEDG